MQFIMGIVTFALYVVGILDVVKQSFSGGKKALWIIVILVLPIVGFVVYWFVGRKKTA